MQLKEAGFLNYFGLQRFGTGKGAKTHDVGRLILLQDYEGAFKKILLQDCGFKDIQEAKAKYLETWDHDVLIRAFPRQCVGLSFQSVYREGHGGRLETSRK